jgi:hypothetical protein
MIPIFRHETRNDSEFRQFCGSKHSMLLPEVYILLSIGIEIYLERKENENR